jgi:hypothetical protein
MSSTVPHRHRSYRASSTAFPPPESEPLLPTELLCAACGKNAPLPNNGVCSYPCFLLDCKNRNPDFAKHLEYEIRRTKSLSESNLSPLNTRVLPDTNRRHWSSREGVIPGRVCLFCLSANALDRQDFCGPICVENAASRAPLLLPVPPEHHALRYVLSCLNNKDTKVEFVYRIVCTKSAWAAFSNYRDSLEQRSLYPGSNRVGCWVRMQPCSNWSNIGSKLELCNTPNGCPLRELLYLDQQPSSFQTVARGIKDTPDLQVEGYICHVLTEACIGRAFKVADVTANPRPPAFYDSITFDGRQFSYFTIPRQAQLPRYLVFTRCRTA